MLTTLPTPPQTPLVRRPRHQGLVLTVTCLALGTVVAAMASLNVALPDIARQTHADQTQQAWIVDAYSLVFASLLLPAGAVGDRYGRRLALLVGLVVFGAGSGVATLTTDPTALAGLRALLGVGAALIMPATLSTITSSFPAQRRAAAVSIWTAVAGASGVVGLLASGLLLQWWSWQSIFWLNVVLAAVALTGTLLFVPESAERDPLPLDVVGAVLAAAGIAVLVYAVIEAPAYGWTDPVTVGGIALGLLILAGFVVIEMGRRYPLLDPRLFTNSRFAAGSLAITLQFFALFGFLFVIMQYLQSVRHYSALTAALGLLTMPIGMIPSSRLSPYLTERFGIRLPWVAGLLIVAEGLMVLAHLDSADPYWHIASGLIPLGAGLGLAMPPATTAITGALPSRLQNVGTAVNDLARELGGALGIAVLGSLLTATYRNHLPTAGAVSAFCTGLHVSLTGAALTIVATAIAVAALLRRPHRPGRHRRSRSAWRGRQRARAGFTAASDPKRVELFQQRHRDSAGGSQDPTRLAHRERLGQCREDLGRPLERVRTEHDRVGDPGQPAGAYRRGQLTRSEPQLTQFVGFRGAKRFGGQPSFEGAHRRVDPRWQARAGRSHQPVGHVQPGSHQQRGNQLGGR
ncbi:integral membrane transport protein [Mycobacterium ulcerans subsp. shinshuense]|uniref:Integral membrane transport protein n=1 Tax=Mycobacterium ulcerans subsp. shinshuense TaxID=1124626 RepID=A0A1B4XXV8_MYCUL|nr:integral membrane transport protein [Mycobacterium ulcerans subsp. shinshuense]